MRFILLISFCLLIGACSKPGYFRSLSDSETVEIKKTKQQFKQDDSYRVLIITNYGNLVVKLFNETPLHRDNFVAKVKSGFYDSLLFHRVINNFMIQGGDPTSKKATESDRLGGGSAPGEPGLPPACCRPRPGRLPARPPPWHGCCNGRSRPAWPRASGGW